MSVALVVVDPALGEAEGHHAGFAAMLAANRPETQMVTVWGHRKMSPMLVQSLVTKGIEVRSTFLSKFYNPIAKSGNTESIIKYISGLALEFADVLRQLSTDDLACCVLYPTMSWEHANALSLALQLYPTPPNIEHRVLLMFNPGIDHNGETSDVRLRLKYRVALNKLRKQPGVRLYASCSELAYGYAALLELENELPIHPCFLGDWRRAPLQRAKGPVFQPKRILLYLGDAKVDKGFNALPEVLAVLRKQLGEQTTFVVQYNKLPTWANKSLFGTERSLQELAKIEPRLNMCGEFWSDEQMQRELAEADLLLLNYDKNEYAEKTSGVLWLAGWYKVPTLLPNGWLQREAERIGLPHAVVDVIHNFKELAPALVETKPNEDYRHTLFSPIWEWISKVRE